MIIYFMRHGDAEERSEDGSDARRRLTPEGKQKVAIEAETLRAIGVELDTILTSPYPRAYETADIIAQAFSIGGSSYRKVNAFSAGSLTINSLQREIGRVHGDSRILIVGHEPDLSDTVRQLMGGGAVQMKKGAVACMEARAIDVGRGTLRWLAHPSLMLRTRA